MSTKLSDERLQQIAEYVAEEGWIATDILPTVAEVRSMVSELIAIRTAGPVMLETPSGRTIDALMMHGIGGRGRTVEGVYRIIRSVLEKEQWM